MQERRDAEEAGAHDRREEVRPHSLGRAVGKKPDPGDRERCGAEESAREPQELPDPTNVSSTSGTVSTASDPAGGHRNFKARRRKTTAALQGPSTRGD